MIEKKALDNPETYGRFDDFDFVARGALQEGKKVRIREIMLYYTAVRQLVLGYKMKYEILESDKPIGKRYFRKPFSGWRIRWSICRNWFTANFRCWHLST